MPGTGAWGPGRAHRQVRGAGAERRVPLARVRLPSHLLMNTTAQEQGEKVGFLECPTTHSISWGSI